MEALLEASQMPSSAGPPLPYSSHTGPRPTASVAADTQWLTSQLTQRPFYSKLVVSDLLGIKSTEQHEGMNAGSGLLPRQQVCCREQVGNPGFFHSPFPPRALRVHSPRDRGRSGQAEEAGGWQEPADISNSFWVSLTGVRVLQPTGFYLRRE